MPIEIQALGIEKVPESGPGHIRDLVPGIGEISWITGGIGLEQDSSKGILGQSPIKMGWNSLNQPYLCSGIENHGRMSLHWGSHDNAGKEKLGVGLDLFHAARGCLTALSGPHPVGEPAVWCRALCWRQVHSRWLTLGSGNQAVSGHSPWCETWLQASEPPGPQRWGPRPPGRERRFTQHESHNIAGDPQKAFKCLFFKVVSKAGEKLSEIWNEEFNSESAKRWKEAETEDSGRRGPRIWGEKYKGWEQGEKHNGHISERAQVDNWERCFPFSKYLLLFQARYFLCLKSPLLYASDRPWFRERLLQAKPHSLSVSVFTIC